MTDTTNRATPSGRVWDDLLSPLDREVYKNAGYGQRGGGGARPAVLVIDITFEFTGLQPEPILESIKRFPNSCGSVAWESMERIATLLERARALGLPVFYTKAMDEANTVTRGSWGWKKSTDSIQMAADEWQLANTIPPIIAPAEGETVIQKTKPSAFFGTPLASYLVELGVDTLLVTGTTTSGCVRASVIDAFSYNFRTMVIEDCVFDRGDAPHRLNLFDMQAKYADVVPLEQVFAYLDSLSGAAEAQAAAG
jgi:nicotinamidase-related amidase